MKYYIVIDKKKKGPLSLEDLKKYKLERNTLVWRVDIDDWKSAEKFDELKYMFVNSPPQIPGIKESPNPSYNYSKRLKKEIRAFLYAILFSLIITFIFSCIYSVINKPDYLTDRQLKRNSESMYEIVKENQYGSIPIGQCLNGNNKYTSRINSDDIIYGNINLIFKRNFRADVQSKALLTFVLSFLSLFVGRYLLLGINLAKKSSKP